MTSIFLKHRCFFFFKEKRRMQDLFFLLSMIRILPYSAYLLHYNRVTFFTINKNFWHCDVLILTLGTLVFTSTSLNFSEIRKTWLGVIISPQKHTVLYKINCVQQQSC
jgi:hypothetical protein